MAKKRNLSKEDLNEITTYEENNKLNVTNGNKINLDKISIKIKCLNEKQKELKRLIEENEIVVCSGPSGCLIKSEKIKIYILK